MDSMILYTPKIFPEAVMFNFTKGIGQRLPFSSI
jgi:hypothetical protein